MLVFPENSSYCLNFMFFVFFRTKQMRTKRVFLFSLFLRTENSFKKQALSCKTNPCFLKS